MAIIPSIFTFLNMFSGFLSIYFSFTGNFDYSAYLIMLASIFDMIDGRLARALKITSEIGKHLDSFSDFTTFGITPAMFFINLLKDKINIYVLIILGFIYVINATMRLSLYNINEAKKDEFSGMPSTFAGISTATIFGFNYIGSLITIVDFNIPYLIFIPVFIIYSFLMVSKIRYKKFGSVIFNFKTLRNIVFNILFISCLVLFFKYFMLILVIFYTLSPFIGKKIYEIH